MLCSNFIIHYYYTKCYTVRYLKYQRVFRLVNLILLKPYFRLHVTDMKSFDKSLKVAEHSRMLVRGRYYPIFRKFTRNIKNNMKSLKS